MMRFVGEYANYLIGRERRLARKYSHNENFVAQRMAVVERLEKAKQMYRQHLIETDDAMEMIRTASDYVAAITNEVEPE